MSRSSGTYLPDISSPACGMLGYANLDSWLVRQSLGCTVAPWKSNTSPSLASGPTIIPSWWVWCCTQPSSIRSFQRDAANCSVNAPSISWDVRELRAGVAWGSSHPLPCARDSRIRLSVGPCLWSDRRRARCPTPSLWRNARAGPARPKLITGDGTHGHLQRRKWETCGSHIAFLTYSTRPASWHVLERELQTSQGYP
jgi:hypothetical protein